MNKLLIESIADKAVELVQNRPNGTCDMGKYNTEFARLIINECIKLINLEYDGLDPEDLIPKIEDHFGI